MDQYNSYNELEKATELLMNVFNNILFNTPEEFIVAPTRSNLNEIISCLNNIFPENKCIDAIYTPNYDKLFFGIRVNPTITAPDMINIIANEDKMTLNSYKIEFDSKLFNMGLSPQELTAYTLYEISSMCASYQIIDDLRAVIDLNMTSNEDTIYLKDSAHYAQLVIFAVKDALTKLSSLIYKDGPEEYVSNSLIQALDLDEFLISAHDSIISNLYGTGDSLRASNTSILQWMFLMYRDMRTNSSTIMDTLRDYKTTTGSKLDIEEINKTIDSINRIDAKITPQIEAMELPKFFDAMNMSAVNEFSLFAGLKRNGLRSIEDFLYEAAMKVKNLETEEEAVFLMRSLSTRMNILADYIYNTPGISDRERMHWEDVYDRYNRLREELVKKKIWNRKQYGLFFDYNQDFGDKPYEESAENPMDVEDDMIDTVRSEYEKFAGDSSKWNKISQKNIDESADILNENSLVNHIQSYFAPGDIKLDADTINKAISKKKTGAEKLWITRLKKQMTKIDDKRARMKLANDVKQLEKLNLISLVNTKGFELAYDAKTNKVYGYDIDLGYLGAGISIKKLLSILNASIYEGSRWDGLYEKYEYTDEQLEADLDKISFDENGVAIIDDDEPEFTEDVTDDLDKELSGDHYVDGKMQKVSESDQVEDKIDHNKETKDEVSSKVPDSVDITIPDDINESVLFGETVNDEALNEFLGFGKKNTNPGETQMNKDISDIKSQSNINREASESCCTKCGSSNITFNEGGNYTCNECGASFFVNSESTQDWLDSLMTEDYSPVEERNNESTDIIEQYIYENYSELDDDTLDILESITYDPEVIDEISLKEFMDTIKNWKTSNFKNKKSSFISNSLSDEEYDEVKGYIDTMVDPQVKFNEYHQAFNALCKFCFIEPRGTIITSYNVKRGPEDGKHTIELEYIANTKKIKLPDGIKLFHISKIPGITKLVPQFKGKSGKGYLYERPRVYFTIRNFLSKLHGNKTYSYECTANIHDVYVDPLVWKARQGAVYVESDTDIPVKEVKLFDNDTEDVEDNEEETTDDELE